MKHLYLALLLLPGILNGQMKCLQSFSSPTKVNEFSETEQEMLISTDMGFFVIDKASLQLTNYYDNFNSSLPSRRVQSATRDREGDLWVISGNQLVQIKNGSTIPRRELTNQLAGPTGAIPVIRRILNIVGDVYLTTNLAGVYQLNQNKLSNLKCPIERVNTQNIWRYNDSTFVGTSQGLGIIEKDKIRFFGNQDSYFTRACDQVALDKHQNFWMANGTRMERHGKQGRQFYDLYKNKSQEPFKQSIRSVFNDLHGNVYALVEGILFQYINEVWEVIAQSPVTGQIQFAYVDRQGEVWGFGDSFGGLKVWRNNNWQEVVLPGFRSNDKIVHQFDRAGNDILMVTYRQIYNFNGKTLLPLIPEKSTISGTKIVSISDQLAVCAGKSGNEGFKVRQINPKTGEILMEAVFKSDNSFVDDVGYQNDSIFVAFGGKEYYYSLEQNKITFLRNIVLPGIRLLGVRWDKKGNAWAWSHSGIFKRAPTNGEWKKITTTNTSVQQWKSLRAFELTPDDIPIILFSFQIYLLEDEKNWREIGKLPVSELACQDPFYFAVIDTSHYWVGRRGKLFEYHNGKWNLSFREELKDRLGWLQGLTYDSKRECLFVSTSYEVIQYFVNCEENSPTKVETTTPVLVETRAREVLPQDLALSCFPNPFTDLVELQIESSSAADLLISASTLDGKLLFSKEYRYQRSPIPLSFTKELSAGVYLISVIQEGRRVTKKVVKVRE
ncbi:MAG: T9SS type A sorting domain-containing protein [Saprospiraceae bacterium]|nr:T9SS type A sorting domain-containing protein [Saprospiraceae bacterium]